MQDLQVIDILPQMITLSEAYIQVSPPDYGLIIVVLQNNRPDKRLLFKFFFFFVCFFFYNEGSVVALYN